ncbi:MAG: glyceraldehyde 3-phosphate dehydrogenase NAD-binding domain-containing protein [Nitrospira sp.]|nr:glyceraldehyde 3-phosphate dehydrogenase NAD-binding domain-containing protein [Nitrospira sp.]
MARRTLRYVEPLSDARTPLADFFSILLDMSEGKGVKRDMATIAINGLGRIGCAAFKIILETSELELRAVNALNAADDLAYLLNYNTVYGPTTRRSFRSLMA